MSLRLNLYGFSLGRTRQLFRSRDEAAIRRIRERLAEDHPHWRADEVDGVGAIVDQAILEGVPFRDLVTETNLHARALVALAGDGQDWLPTSASVYGASALEDGPWRRFGKETRPEVRAFLRGLVEGIPLFGQRPPPAESTYAAIGLEKLRTFLPGLTDLRDGVAYRLGRKKSSMEEDRDAAEFLAEFCGWVEQIVEAERDLLFLVG